MTMLIGITGKKGAGKDTAAGALMMALGLKRRPFAGALKAMVRALLEYQGVDAHTVERMIEGDLKETPSTYLNGRTPRYVMQTLGTDWGRCFIGEDFWVNVWSRAVEADKGRCVVTDVRFDNEAEAIHERGGVVIEVRRAGANGDAHASEAGVSTQLVDRILVNDAETPELFQRVVLEELVPA